MKNIFLFHFFLFFWLDRIDDAILPSVEVSVIENKLTLYFLCILTFDFFKDFNPITLDCGDDVRSYVRFYKSSKDDIVEKINCFGN
jgi:hypothetical protein